MKATIGTVVLTLLPLAAAAQKPPPHHPAGAAESTAPDMTKLQDLMRRMRAQMDTLRSTTDPAERHKLLVEHIRLLQEHMRLLRGAEPAPAPSGGMAGHEDGGMPGVAPRSRARMVEDRIDMLAMAMEQMEGQILELARDRAPKKQ
jgi:hypothetical protein